MSFPRRPSPVFSDEYRAMIEVVRSARRKAGFTQRKLAAGLGKSNSHVCMIEKGQRRLDTLELFKIARCLGLPPSELFARIEKKLEACGEAAAS